MMVAKQSQQDFLRDAMQSLGLSRDGFSRRFSVPRSTLDKWLAPTGSNEYRAMPEMAWAYVSEVLSENK